MTSHGLRHGPIAEATLAHRAVAAAAAAGDEVAVAAKGAQGSPHVGWLQIEQSPAFLKTLRHKCAAGCSKLRVIRG